MNDKPKKKSSTSPTKRTMDLCRKQGLTVQVVERWNQFAKVRQDLFGFIDLVAMGNGSLMGIQSTSATNMAARIAKIKLEPLAKQWLDAGGRIIVHGWKQAKNKRWECRETELFRADLEQTEASE